MAEAIIRCACGETLTYPQNSSSPWDERWWNDLHMRHWFLYRVNWTVHAPDSYVYTCPKCHSAAWEGWNGQDMGR